jgi:hypothetical protein
MPDVVADWYDDPDGSGGERWWDGHGWTTHRRPKLDPLSPTTTSPSPPWQPSSAYPPRGSNSPAPTWLRLGRNRNIRLLAIVGALVAVAILALLISSSGDSGEPGAGETSDGFGLSGSLDDWLSEMCRPGSYKEPAAEALGSATSSGYCAVDPGGRGYVFVGTYSSEFMMRNDLANLGAYAVGERGNTMVVFALGPGQREPGPLQPLEAHGFVLKPPVRSPS